MGFARAGIYGYKVGHVGRVCGRFCGLWCFVICGGGIVIKWQIIRPACGLFLRLLLLLLILDVWRTCFARCAEQLPGRNVEGCGKSVKGVERRVAFAVDHAGKVRRRQLAEPCKVGEFESPLCHDDAAAVGYDLAAVVGRRCRVGVVCLFHKL